MSEDRIAKLELEVLRLREVAVSLVEADMSIAKMAVSLAAGKTTESIEQLDRLDEIHKRIAQNIVGDSDG